jgi:UDP-2-acetamido-2,6-beta-L-arabino-hexul-4-ose reductase
MEQTQSTPHVLFSSSTQEELDNNYGNSKKAGRELLVNWAARNQAPFTGMVIPNVFGPFGNPFYNSVIATFSHLLTHGGQPQIMVDNQLKLIYVGELVDQIWNIISERKTSANYHIPHTSEAAVSEILKTLVRYKEEYFDLAVIPKISNRFELNLFNTFRSYISHNEYFPFLLKKNTDNRGSFVETVKTQKEGQFSYSTTVPGITRGEHFHTRKIERFAVIQGKAVIELRRIGSSEVLHFELDGENPSFVDMPVWYTHNITNTGETTLVTLFWISEFFDPTDTDTFFEKVRN